MTDDRPGVDVLTLTLQLPATAASLLAHDGHASLTALLERDLTALLEVFGVPAAADVRVTLAEAGATAERGFHVTVNDRVIRYPDELLNQAHAYVTDGLPDPEMTPARIDEWVAAAGAATADAAQRATAVAFCRVACRAIVTREPDALFGPGQAHAYAQSLVRETTGTSGPLPDTERLHAILPAVLSLGIPIANRSAVARILAGASDRSDAAVREELIEALRADAVAIRMEEGLLRQVTTRWEQEGTALFPFLRDGLAVELGLVFPRLRFAADRDLRPGTFAFQVNEIKSVPLRALAAEQLLLNDTVERVRDLDPAAAATVNPGSAYPASVVASSVKSAAVDRGLTTWGQLDHIVLCLAEFLRQHGWRTVHRAGVRNQLRTVRAAFPALVTTVQRRLPEERITAVLRSLLRDRVAVRNLRGVLEGCLEDSSVEAPGRPATSDARSDDELVAMARAALGREIAQRAARGTNALVVYLLDAGIERLAVEETPDVSARAADRILGAIRAELRYLPATAQAPHLLTMQEARATLQRIVATEYPRMAVLAHEELPPGINLMPVARIQLQA